MASPVAPWPPPVSRSRARAGLVGFGIANAGVLAFLTAPLIGLTDEKGRSPLPIWLVAAGGMGVGFWCFGVPRERRRRSLKSVVVPAALAAEWPPRVVLWIARVFQVAGLVALATFLLRTLQGR